MRELQPTRQLIKVDKKISKALGSVTLQEIIRGDFEDLTKVQKKFLSSLNRLVDAHVRIFEEVSSSVSVVESGQTRIIQEWGWLVRAAAGLRSAGRPIAQGLRRMFGRSRLKDAARRAPPRARNIAQNALRRKTNAASRAARLRRGGPRRFNLKAPLPKMRPSLSRAANKLAATPRVRGAFRSLRGNMSKLWNWFKNYISRHFSGGWKAILGQWFSTVSNIWLVTWVFDIVKGLFGLGDSENPGALEAAAAEASTSTGSCYDGEDNMITKKQMMNFFLKNNMIPKDASDCDESVKGAIVTLEEHLELDEPGGVFDAEVALASVSAGLMTPNRNPSQQQGSKPPRWCRRARTKAEVSICNTPGLWKYEQENLRRCRATNCVKSDRASVISFLRRREACGGNIECIKKVYQQRLASMAGPGL